MKEGWEIKELQDCLSYIKNGANIKQTKGASGIPITRIETLSGGQFHRDKLGYADVYELGKFAPYVLDDADILMSHINSKAYIGRSVIYHKQGDEQIIHGMNLLRLKFFPDMINPEFANYYFKCTFFLSEVAKIRKDAVNQSSMAISDLKRIAIPVPPLSEQQHIVEELDLLSSIIEKKKAQLNELDNLAQSLFYEMFGDPITNDKGWEIKKLGEVCEIVRGGSPRPIDKFLGGNIPWIKIGDATKGDDIYLYSTKEHIIEEGLRKTRYIPKGSLIFANCGVSLGFARIIQFDGCIHDGWLALMNISENKLNKVFLLKSLNFCTTYFRNLAPDGTQPNLNTSIMKLHKQIIPPIIFQDTYVERLGQIEHQKTLIQKSIEQVETLFNSRMDYYFN